MQADGNLVLFKGSRVKWNTGTWGIGYPPYRLIMQHDNNLAIYDRFNKLLWHSHTNNKGSKGAWAEVNDDGSFILNDGRGRMIWSIKRANKLENGRVLHNGQQLKSQNGKYRLSMQTDGNLVLFQGSKLKWHTHTSQIGYPPFRLVMQHDNNLAIYDRFNKVIWHSHTHGKGVTKGAWVKLMNDGNFVIKDKFHKTLWSLSGSSELANGQALQNGQELKSPSKKHRLSMQADGNLVLFNGNAVKWSTATHGKGYQPFRLIMQHDNNLAIYDRFNKVLWHSHTHGKGATGARAVLQNDGNFVIYDGHRQALWSAFSHG